MKLFQLFPSELQRVVYVDVLILPTLYILKYWVGVLFIRYVLLIKHNLSVLDYEYCFINEY